MFKNAHWVALISVVIIFAAVDSALYVVGFGGMLLSGIASDDVYAQVWSLIGAVSWVASVVLGGACVGELWGRGWCRYKNE
ncbi:hypothetical protein [Sporomusa malonica]|uniref:Uncharacterized protein n=1 Tax=Sporomusa malonica TaxID=112901 RepID=A0A1W2AQ34_9FIRM|nr:hypothetical protein [Sporomusa malonica]SMC62817.1 hypothetical protein SAMN04488500_10643 [Sporomusa malonica]